MQVVRCAPKCTSDGVYCSGEIWLGEVIRGISLGYCLWAECLALRVFIRNENSFVITFYIKTFPSFSSEDVGYYMSCMSIPLSVFIDLTTSNEHCLAYSQGLYGRTFLHQHSSFLSHFETASTETFESGSLSRCDMVGYICVSKYLYRVVPSSPF
jgi:hypothetical protein